MGLKAKVGPAKRCRSVRVLLTEEEHGLLRAASAYADRSLSRYAVVAIVESAWRTLSLRDQLDSADMCHPEASQAVPPAPAP